MGRIATALDYFIECRDYNDYTYNLSPVACSLNKWLNCFHYFLRCNNKCTVALESLRVTALVRA